MDPRFICLAVLAIALFVYILVSDAGADGHQ
jgi:hypothetical protein